VYFITPSLQQLDKIKYLFFTVDQKRELSKEVHKYLVSLYISDIQSLEKLIDRDLSHWYKIPKTL
jgi:cytochrome oxidase Cu insertion factor (SCO1/SenC/PrrC family)